MLFRSYGKAGSLDNAVHGVIEQVPLGKRNFSAVKIYPRLEGPASFGNKEPLTLVYQIGVSAFGLLKDNYGNMTQITAMNNAGAIEVTGSNGKITDINAVPTDRKEAKPVIAVSVPASDMAPFLR